MSIEDNRYVIRRKVLTIMGQKFHVYDGHGKLLEMALRVDVHAVIITTQPEFGACYYLQQPSQQEPWQR